MRKKGGGAGTNMLDLFPKPSVGIQRLNDKDARGDSDSLKTLIHHLHSHEDHYPGIGHWVKEKVIPGLKTGERVGFVGFRDESPVLAAVLKSGSRTKFCHLSIQEGFRGDGLGEIMFSLMAMEVRNTAQEIHFTLPEGLWEREQGFFRSFGFEQAVLAPNQYRLFEDEFRCSAPFADVWNSVVARIPTLLASTSITGFDMTSGVILSVREPHARAIIEGRKTVELRRRFSDSWAGSRASIYSSGGLGCLLGEVTIEEVFQSRPDEIWCRFEDGIGCSRDEFDHYVGERPRLSVLRLVDPTPYEAPIPLSQLSYLLGQPIRPPQSYQAVSSSNSWGQALSLAALLHRRVGPTVSHPTTSQIC